MSSVVYYIYNNLKVHKHVAKQLFIIGLWDNHVQNKLEYWNIFVFTVCFYIWPTPQFQIFIVMEYLYSFDYQLQCKTI